jgi:Trk K+ transport system NAD-binding subunit
MKPRIIVCGLGRTGYKIFSLLRQQGAFVVGIDEKAAYEQSEQIIVGDARSATTLLSAGIDRAQTLVLAGSDDAFNLAIVLQARLLNPQIYIVNRLFNTSLGDRLDSTLPGHTTLSVTSLAAPIFAFAALGSPTIGQLDLFDRTWPIQEEYIDSDHPWLGVKLNDLWDNRSRMLIYYLPARGQTDLVSAIVSNQPLQAGDRLIVATQPNQRNRSRISPRIHLTQLAIRMRQFWRHVQSAAIVTLLLFVTIVIATFTYRSANVHISPIDALYFSVGMITGAGGQESVAEHAPDGIKLFTTIMMLVGAGVVGIAYALLNDLVLGTRLQQLWETVPIPPRDHYIICGLGGIGIQTAKHLIANGHEVVAIDSDPNGRFINAAKSLKIPVIQGDATVVDTLTAAKIETCESLLAVTSNDTANLEIALTAKGLIPQRRVVVRSQDPNFAIMAEQVFHFESVLCPSELAAPSFAAAAIGGRILGTGTTAGNLWVALSTRITSEHPFSGQRVRDLAMKNDFVPLYVKTQHRVLHSWDLLAAYLNDGDILYMTILANRLERLWRVSPAQLIDLTKK